LIVAITWLCTMCISSLPFEYISGCVPSTLNAGKILMAGHLVFDGTLGSV